MRSQKNINSKSLYRKRNKHNKKISGGSSRKHSSSDNLEKPDISNEIELINASSMGNLENVKLLLKKGVNINIQDKSGISALYKASNEGNLNIVKLLIDKGANIDIQDNFSDTALYNASYEGYLDIVKLLIVEGANIDIQNKPGDTALHIASYEGYLDIVKLLIDEGANIEIQNKFGDTALHIASYEGYLDIVELLVDKGAKLDIKNKRGETALIIASKRGYLEIVELLVDISFVFVNGDSFPIQDLDIKLNKNKIPINEIYTAIFKSNNRKIKNLTNIPFKIIDNGRAEDIDIRTSRTLYIVLDINSYKEIQIDKDIYYYCNNSGCNKENPDLFKKNYKNNTYKYFGKLKEIIKDMIIKDIPCKKLKNCESCTKNTKCKYKKYTGKKSLKKKGKEGKCVGINHKAKNEADYITDYKSCAERGVQTYETEV